MKKVFAAAAVLAAVAMSAAQAQKQESMGPAEIQLLSFMAPVKKPARTKPEDKFPKETPITLFLEVYEGNDVPAICELSPRIRDAVMETLYYNPIPMNKKRRIDVRRAERLLVKALNKALRGDFVSAVTVELGAKPLKTGSSRSRANALGCALKTE